MQILIEETDIVMIATIEDLRRMEDYDEKIWGVPNQSRTKIIECYLDSTAEDDGDVLIADVYDFMEAEGWTTLGDDPAEDDPYHTTTLRMTREM